VDFLIDRAIDSSVSHEVVWRKLIHYEENSSSPSGLRSAINSKKFFLSDDGDINPEAELIATLRAFSDPVGVDSNAHPQCLFRGRFVWLRSLLSFDISGYPEVKCSLYEDWISGHTVDSVSMVFATGYLGNPASYYGHTLLKFNSEASSPHSELLNVSVNYGAIVPKNEGPIRYILKGIFGGYDAGFSHIDYYFHNHNYGETELRDLWEYELDFTAEEVSLITAHSWELLGQEYTYFFFRKNCVFRMAEILELIDGVEIIPRDRIWTIPQVVIENLGSLERNGRPVVSRIIHHPSRQTRLYTKHAQIDEHSRTVLEKIIDDNSVLERQIFTGLDVSRKQDVLDVALDYYQYRKSLEKEPNDIINEAHRLILAKRFSLPARARVWGAENENHPHKDRDPSLTRLGVFHNSELGYGVGLLVRPAYYDALDSGASHVRNSQLGMGETELVIFDGHVDLRKIEFISVESVNGAVTGLARDNGNAWKFKVGVEAENLSCQQCLIGKIQADYGYSRRLGDTVLFVGYLGGAMQTSRNGSGSLNVKTSLAVIFSPEQNFRIMASFENRQHLHGLRKQEDLVTTRVRYSWDKNWDAQLAYRKHVATESSISIGYYW
jgi:hypothetical protein